MGQSKKFNNINDWLKDVDGKNALQHDKFDWLEKDYKQMVDTGKHMHDIRSSIQKFQKACAEAEFGNLSIEVLSDGSSVITARPTDSKINMSDAECPQIIIEKVKDGFIVRNHGAAANNPVVVRGQNGMVGFASAITAGIDKAAADMTAYNKSWGKYEKDLRVRASKMRKTISTAMGAYTHLNPNVYSKNQLKDYADSVDATNFNSMRLEGMELLKSQAILGAYYHQIFQSHQSKINGFKGAPRNEKELNRDLESIMNAARGAKDFAELDRYVRSKYPWVYNNIWKGDTENLYKMVAGKIKQGGKKEGAAGILSLREADIPFAEFENYGRKIKQNLQHLKRDYTYGGKNKHGGMSAASGLNRLFTKTQWQKLKASGLSEKEIFQDVYNVGELQDRFIMAAYEELAHRREEARKAKTWTKEQEARFQKQRLQAMRGFGKDASFMSESAKKDFYNTYETDYLHGIVSVEDVDNAIKKNLTRSEKHKAINAGKTAEEIAEIVEEELKKLKDDKKNTGHDSYRARVKNYLQHYFQLNSKTRITDWEIGTDENGKDVFQKIQTSKLLENTIFTARGGATSDFRSVIAAMDDELMALAFHFAGYSDKDIYKNGKDISGGLKIHVARERSELNEKTIRTQISEKTQYVLNKLFDEKKGNQDEINKALKGSVFEGSIVYKGDHFEYDPEKIVKQFLHKDNRGGKAGSVGRTPLDLLKNIVKFGQDQGFYDKGMAFSDFIDSDQQRLVGQVMPLIGAMELQMSSVFRYQGMGDQTKSGSKFTWRELASLEGTIGDMRARGLSEEQIAPMVKFQKALQEKMHEQSKQYDEYKKNLTYLNKTFSRDTEALAKEVSPENKRIKVLTLEDIKDIKTDSSDRKYVSKGARTGIMGDQFNTENFLYQKKLEHFRSLSAEEQKAIGSAENVQLVLDSGDILVGNDSGEGGYGDLLTTRYVFLGKGGALELNKDGSLKNINGMLMPSDIDISNNRIIRNLQDVYKQRKMPTDADSLKHAERKAVSTIAEETRAMQESILSGPTYEQFSTLQGDESSGYLLLSALNENSEKIYKDILKEKGIKDSNAPNQIISTQTAAAMLEKLSDEQLDSIYKAIGKKPERVKKRGTKIGHILNAYDISSSSFQGKTLDSNLFERSPIIKFVSDLMGGRAVFSSDKSFVTSGNMLITRGLAATTHGDMDGDRVAYFNALLEGDLDKAENALASYYKHLEENQREIIEKDKKKEKGLISGLKRASDKSKGSSPKDSEVKAILADQNEGFYSTIKKDFFDLVKEKNPEVSEVLKGSNAKNFQELFSWSRTQGQEVQDALDENIERLLPLIFGYGEVGKINKVADPIEQRIRAAAINAAAPGSGVYGNLLFAMSKIFSSPEVALQGDVADNIGNFSSQIMMNIAHTLYQEGINPKNIKTQKGENLDGPTVVSRLKDLMTRATLSKTWDDERSLTAFLADMENMGFAKADDFFKGEIIGNLDLKHIMDRPGGEELRTDLLGIAERAKDRYAKAYGEKSQEVKRLQQDYNAIQKLSDKIRGLDSLSREMIVAIILDEQTGLRSKFKNGTTPGQNIHNQYSFLPGYGYHSLLNKKSFFGEEEIKKLKASGYSEEQIKKIEKATSELTSPEYRLVGENVSLRLRENEKTKEGVPFWGAAPTTQAARVAPYLNGVDEGSFSLYKTIVAALDGDTKALKELKNTPNIDESEKTLKATIGGTIAHSASEQIMKDIASMSTAEIEEYFKKFDMAQFLKKNSQEIEQAMDVLSAANFNQQYRRGYPEGDKNRAKFLEDYVRRGITNAQVAKNILIGDKGKVLGTEVPLTGFGLVENGSVKANRQIADLIYLTEDEDGHYTLHIGDYKTNASGDPHATNPLQLADYARSLRLLGEDARRKGAGRDLSARAYLDSVNDDPENAILQGWVKRLEEYASRDKDREIEKGSREYNKRYDKAFEYFSNIYEALRDETTKISTELIIQGANGIARIFKVNTPNDIFSKYLQGEQLTAEEKKRLVEDHEIMQRISTQYTKDPDKLQAEFAREEYKKVKEALQGRKDQEDKIRSLETQKEILERGNEVNPEKIAELEKQISEEKELLGTEDQIKELENLEEELEKYENSGKKSDMDKYAEIKEKIDAIKKTYAYKIQQEIEALKALDEEHGDEQDSLYRMGLRHETVAELLGEFKKEETSSQNIEDDWENYAAAHKQYIENAKERRKIVTEMAKAQKEQEKYKDTDQEYWELQNNIDWLKNKEIDLLVKNKSIEEAIEKGENNPNFADPAKELKQAERKAFQFNEKEREALVKKILEGKGPDGKEPPRQGGGFLGMDAYTLRWVQRIMNGGLIFSFIRTVRKGLQDITNKAKQLDQAMTNLRIVTGEDAKGARELISTYSQMGKELGATTLEITQSATAWARQGYQMAEVNELIKSSMYLSKLGMIDANTAVKDLTSAMHGFKMEASESMDIVDKFTALDVKAATTAGDIAQGLAQFANLAKLNGVTIDQASAYVATIADVNQKSGSEVGQGLKTILSRYGNVKAGAYNKLNLEGESSDTEEKLNDVERVLTKMGISIRDTNLEFKDFDEVLDEIADKWELLDNVSKKAIANAFAGIRQQEQFLILLENYDKYKELLEVSENSEGTAERKYQSYKESYAAAQARLNAAKEGIANDSQISKLLITLTNAATGIIEFFQKIYPWIPMMVSSMFSLKEAFGSSTMTLIGTSLKSLSGKGGESGFLNKWIKAKTASWKKEEKIEKEKQVAEAQQTTTIKNNTTSQKANTAATDQNSNAKKDETKSSVNSYRALGFAISTVTAAVAQFWTAGTTHSYNGETVESSEQAQKAGGGVSAVISMIPIIGPLIGPWVASSVAAAFDEERDYANAASEKAAERMSELTNVSSYLDRIQEGGFGSEESQKALSDFAQNIYSEDYEITRKLLQQYLGEKDISSYLKEIQDNTGDTAEAAYEQLKIATLEAEKAQVSDKYSSQLYKNNANFNDLYAEYTEYDGNKTDNYLSKTLGYGAAGLATGGLAAAASIAVAGGPVGWIIGGLLAAGTAIGIAAGHLSAAAETEKEIQEQAQKQKNLDSMDNVEKLKYFTDLLNKEYGKTEKERDATKISQLNQLINSLKSQNSILNQIREETNKLTLEQAFVSAKGVVGGREKSLSSMTVAELKYLGVDEILRIFGESIMANGGLKGENFYGLNGEISSSGYEFLMKKLRAQNDDEINAVLSGKSYTLAESLLLSGEYGKRIRASFAAALNTTEETLKDLERLYGVLTLSEITSSSKEKIDQVEKYSSLVDSIGQGAGKTSEWMNTIITQFPELIQYMGQTPNLFDEIVKKIKALAAVQVQTQFDEVLTSDKYYTDTEKAFINLLGEKSAEAELVRGTKATNYQGIVTLISRLGDTEQAKNIQKALTKMLDALNFTSTLMATNVTPVLEVQDKLLERQLNNLNEQKQALQDINSQREYENKLIEARNNLENAQKNKSRVYRAGIGFVYEANQEEIIKAQKELENVQREKEISAIDVQIQELEYQRSELSSILEKANFEEQLKSMNSILGAVTNGQGGSLYSLINTLSSTVEGIKGTAEQMLGKQIDVTGQGREKAINELKSLWEDVLAQREHTGAYNTAVEAYYNKLKEYKTTYQLEEKDLADLLKMGNLQGGLAAGSTAWEIGEKDLNKLTDTVEERYQIGSYISGYTRTDLDLLPDEEKRILNNINSKNSSVYLVDKNGNTIKLEDKKDFELREGETSLTNILERIKTSGDYSEIIISDNEEDLTAVYKDDTLSKMVTDKTKLREKASSILSQTNFDQVYKNYFLTEEDKEKYREQILGAIMDRLAGGYNDHRIDRRIKGLDDLIDSAIGVSSTNVTSQSLDEYISAKQAEEYEEKYTQSFSEWKKNSGLIKPAGMPESAWNQYLRGLYAKYVEENGLFSSASNSSSGGGGGRITRSDVNFTYASGSLSTRPGISLLNELGTEAIVTPGGTITALPSGAGIVPADITSNLWQLGEIAPGLLRIMQDKLSPDTIGKSTLGMITDESFNINNLEMNVNADASFDVDKFMNSIKSRISLTRNLKN